MKSTGMSGNFKVVKKYRLFFARCLLKDTPPRKIPPNLCHRCCRSQTSRQQIQVIIQVFVLKRHNHLWTSITSGFLIKVTATNFSRKQRLGRTLVLVVYNMVSPLPDCLVSFSCNWMHEDDSNYFSFSEGASLASIEDPSEQEFIKNHIKIFEDSHSYFWIGLYKNSRSTVNDF